MSCGRIRKSPGNGWTPLVDGELKDLKVGILRLQKDEKYVLETDAMEYACVLIQGECRVRTESGTEGILGPRPDPFGYDPYGIFLTRDEKAVFTALCNTTIGVGIAPALHKTENSIITPDKTGGGERGSENWQRNVRFVLWSDNTRGNMLMAGETCVPSGNWSTMPPHRHQYDIPGKEVPYDEVYYFQFSRDTGFGMAWQFDDEGKIDQAYSLKNNDAIYMGEGYHPVVCGPGAMMYQLTMMAGPHRESMSRVHDDYQYLLDRSHMKNPYASQHVNKDKGRPEVK